MQRLSQQFSNFESSKNIQSIEMNKIKLKNLRVVFGRPYLFRHLEGCDHIIIFKDLRILSENYQADIIKKD